MRVLAHLLACPPLLTPASPARAWLAGTVLVAALPAQLQFAELGKRHLPVEEDPTTAVVCGDVDRDGDLDLIMGTAGRQKRLYLNDGTGTFTDATAARMPFDRDSTFALALGDVDGDGDLDLIVGNDGQQNRLYLNIGTGTFADATAGNMPGIADSTRALALGDVDRDGDVDLIVGVHGHQKRLYLNNGAGTFADATATTLPVDRDQTRALALGDVDRDGDLDLIVGNDAQQNRLYLNNGAGTFTDATAARMPVDRDSTQALALGDVDGDSDLDLIVGGNQLYYRAKRLYLNNGTGTFIDATDAHMPADSESTRALALGDVDRDGDLDLIVGNAHYGQNRLYLNSGTGIFTDATAKRIAVEGDYTQALALGDVDRDGDLDLIVGNYRRPDRLYLNNGTGTFTDATTVRMPVIFFHATNALALGDVDGDGDLDLIAGNGYPSTQSRQGLYLNDGAGSFTDASGARMPVDRGTTAVLALGDVDRDGDLDLIFGSAGQDRLYLNSGNGSFTDTTATRMPVDRERANALALGDVDGDGDPDLVIGNVGQQNRLYMNDGAGVFTDATAGRMPAESDLTTSLALGDVDRDGDLDLVVGNIGLFNGQKNRLYLNNGAGTFTDATGARMPVDSDHTTAVALGDVDSDGDLDLVVGNTGLRNGEQDRLYLNSGAGVFTDATAARMPVDTDFATALALGDVDGDGDLDLIIGNGSPLDRRQQMRIQQNRLYLNNGAGTFTDVTMARMPVHGSESNVLALGDVDGDGDLDLVFGDRSGEEGNRIFLNLVRQLDAPYLLRAGRTYQIDVYARHGPASQFDLALPYLSGRRAHILLPPFGTLGIDPRRLIALPPLLVPQPAGVATLTLPIPDLPALVGVTLHTQALLLRHPVQASFTNVVSEVFLR